jgi:hypothetical protein
VDKVYIVKLTQTGTNPPVASIIRNTLGGVPVWTYSSPGVYVATLAGAFDPTANVVIESNAAFSVVVNSINAFTLTATGGNDSLSGTPFELTVFDATSVIVNPIDLTTVAIAKEQLGIASIDTGKDLMLQRWLTWTSEYIEKECNRKFQLQTITGEILDGNDMQEIFPRWNPVNAFVTLADITQDVMYRTDPTATWTPIETDVTKIILNPNTPWKIILWEQYFPLGVQNVKLNYVAGYSSVPAKIQTTCIDALQVMWHRSRQGDNWMMKSSFSSSAGGANFNTVLKDMSKESHDALNQYRRLI